MATSITVNVFSLPSAARTVGGNSGDLDVSALEMLGIDTNLTAISGAAATLTIIWERKGVDGIYYPIFTSVGIVATGQNINTVGPASNALTQSHMIGLTGRIRYTITGTTPSVTFSLNVVGK